MAVSFFGARGKAAPVESVVERVKSFEKAHDCTVQIFRADRIFGAIHLAVALEHAQRSFEQGRNRSSHLGTEVLLYAAADRQIKNAIKLLGVTADTVETALLLVGDAEPDELLASLGLDRDDSVLEGEKDYAAFGIGEDEIAAVGRERVSDLILERMALSELER